MLKAVLMSVTFFTAMLSVNELSAIEEYTLKNINSCLNTNIYSYLRHLVVKVLIHI